MSDIAYPSVQKGWPGVDFIGNGTGRGGVWQLLLARRWPSPDPPPQPSPTRGEGARKALPPCGGGLAGGRGKNQGETAARIFCHTPRGVATRQPRTLDVLLRLTDH